jgi:hypothetical protein
LHNHNKSEYFYNKFGKRYTYQNPIEMTRKEIETVNLILPYCLIALIVVFL